MSICSGDEASRTTMVFICPLEHSRKNDVNQTYGGPAVAASLLLR